jgi:hypothetical protein
MCPLRCHDLSVLDRMVDMFIDTLNVSSKMSLSTCPHRMVDMFIDTLNVSSKISLSTCPRWYGRYVY